MDTVEDFEAIAPSGWRAIRYGNREPKKGKRADVYHAIRSYPNRSQFIKRGYTMVDTFGRFYRIADGMDRLEAERVGLVAGGDPALVEPKRVFEVPGDISTSTIIFEGAMGMDRGPQMLYCYIPPSAKKEFEGLGLPNEGEKIKLVHLNTTLPAYGSVTAVNGKQFRAYATGSVILDALIFRDVL